MQGGHLQGVGIGAIPSSQREQTLQLYKTGCDIRKKGSHKDRNAAKAKKSRGSTCQCSVHAHDFGDLCWGHRACNLVRGSKGLGMESWDLIMDHASEYLEAKDNAKRGQTDQGEEELIDSMNLHAHIDLNW